MMTYVSAWRSPIDTQANVYFELSAVSPYTDPGCLEISIESSVFGRSTVNLTMEYWDYEAEAWLEIGTGQTSRFVDSTLRFSSLDNCQRFVHPETGAIRARCRYQGVNTRQKFATHIDAVSWTVTD